MKFTGYQDFVRSERARRAARTRKTRARADATGATPPGEGRDRGVF